MHEKEFERKAILSEKKYTTLLNDFDKNYERENIFQINYYYDTEDIKLFYEEETLRVRQIGNTLKLQYKYNKNKSGEIRISDEYSEILTELPKIIKIKNHETKNIGFMVTERINFDLKICVISLDKNYYFGKIDYEIEAETENESELSSVLKNLEFEFDSKGKYSRFAEKFINQKFNYDLRI